MWCFVINFLHVTPSQEEKREFQLGGRASLLPPVRSLGHSSPGREAGDAQLGDAPSGMSPGETRASPALAQPAKTTPSVFPGRGCARKGLQGSGKRIFWLFTRGAESRVWPEAAAGTVQGHSCLPMKEGHHIAPHCAPPFASAAGSPEVLPQPLISPERIKLTAAGFDGG